MPWLEGYLSNGGFGGSFQNRSIQSKGMLAEAILAKRPPMQPLKPVYQNPYGYLRADICLPSSCSPLGFLFHRHRRPHLLNGYLVFFIS
jgi:hypothetical protein